MRPARRDAALIIGAVPLVFSILACSGNRPSWTPANQAVFVTPSPGASGTPLPTPGTVGVDSPPAGVLLPRYVIDPGESPTP